MMKPHFFFRLSWVLTVLLAVHVFDLDSSIAQTPDTLKAAVPYSIFPIGGMRFNPADTLQGIMGANFNWSGFGAAGTLGAIATESLATDTTITYRDPFYYDTTTSYTVARVAYGWDKNPGYILDAASAIDIRVYMPGTSGITEEYNSAWGTNLGVQHDSAQWIFNTSGVTSGQYVLSNLQDARFDPFTPGGWGDKVLVSNHIGSTSYESVFYFLASDLVTVNDTTPLYSLQYWSLGNGDSTLLATDVITKSMYNTLPLAQTQALGHNVSAENLYLWKGQQANFYKLLRRNLNTRPLWKNSFQNPPVVDVRVRTFKQIPMYFRLLRIRDWRAQQLLTGKADSVLHLVVNDLLAKGTNAQKASWTVGNEPQPKTYHAYSYINDLFAQYHAPPANCLAPYVPDLFLRVMRDQSQYGKPAHLWYEWTPFSGNAWKDEGVDTSTHVAHWQWDYNPNPIPSDVASDSLYWADHDIFIQKDYPTYTSLWQNTIIGHGSESTEGGIGIDRDLKKISSSCYELDPLHPLPFYFMAPAIAAANQHPIWNPVDSLYWIKGGNYSTSARAWADTAYNDSVIKPYLTRHPGETHVPEDSLYKCDYQWRPPTVSEMYYSLWTGVAHGIKGFAYNIAYDDGLSQNGFLWDTTSSIIIKSQDRKYLEYFFGGVFWDPYHIDDNSKWYVDGGGFKFKTYEALPPAFKTMFPTVRTLMTQELAPIVATIAKLSWRGCISWPWRDSTPTYFSRLPVKNVQSRTLTGSLDSSIATYVDLGIHKHPTDTSAVYITVQNRRLWTDSTGTSTIDSRKVSFQIDTSKFPGWSSWPEWSIRDVSKHLKEQVIGLHDTAFYTLKAGQGILLRVAPVVGLTTGGMTTNVFNNARHISLEELTESTANYFMTYERKDSIVVAYPIETPGGPGKRTASANGDSVIEKNALSHNPSICFNSDSSSGLGLVYSVDKAGVNHDSTFIIFRHANKFVPYAYTKDTLDQFRIDGSYWLQDYKAAPAIVPAKSGYGKFWVTYRHPLNGGAAMLVDTLGNHTSPAFFSAGDPHYTKFVSPATHLKRSSKVGSDVDSLYLTFAEDGQIHFLKAWLDTVSHTAIDTAGHFIVSEGTEFCDHELPCTTVTAGGFLLVSWEAEAIIYKPQLIYAMARARSADGTWLNFWSLYGGQIVYESGKHKHLYVANSTSDVEGFTAGSYVWHDLMRLMYQSPTDSTSTIAHSGTDNLVSYSPWRVVRMVEPAKEGSLPARSIYAKDVPSPVMYRYPVSHTEDPSLFDARITRYDFPLTPVTKALEMHYSFSALPKSNDGHLCWPGIVTRVGKINIFPSSGPPLTIITQPVDSAPNKSSGLHRVISWMDSSVRTDSFSFFPGDTLRYQRQFVLGNGSSNDTSKAAGYLSNINDFVRMRIVLRSKITDSLIKVLDTCKLTKGIAGAGLFTQSGSTADSGVGNYVLPSALPSQVYLALEASHADPSDQYALHYCERFLDTIFTSFSADTAPAPKTALPQHPDLPATNISGLSIAVHPNPSTGLVKAEIAQVGNVPTRVAVLDVLGKLVMQVYDAVPSNNTIALEINALNIPNGVYFLRVVSGNQVATRRLLIMR
jgi:hypothetical protein